MTGLEAIGYSHQAGSARRSEPDSGQPIEKSDKTEKPPQAQPVELSTRAVHARLSYDQESKEVIIEILDPQSGDVLRRFPAEELPDDILVLLSEAGSLVETFA